MRTQGFVANSAHDADSITTLRQAIQFAVVVGTVELNEYSGECSRA